MSELVQRLRSTVRSIPDFPKPGILFRDFTPVLLDGKLVDDSLKALWAPFDGQVDIIAGIESRGFILGASIAVQRHMPFVPMRKPGKLPGETYQVSYALEYGNDALEVHKDAIPKGARVLIVDDLLATGGTAAASARLVEQAGGEVVGLGFLIELAHLGGRAQLGDHRIESLLIYE